MSSTDQAPANVRVLVRVRPFNERELKFNPTSVLEVDNNDTKQSIDFGMDSSSTNDNNSNKSEGTISIVEQSGGYTSGYDSGANNNNNNNVQRSFTYDAVFGPTSQQTAIYDSVKGIIDAVCAGYNGTIVAYGQTGSGKTHTIFGEEGLQDDDNNAGLVQRSLKSIFHKIAEQSLISPTSEASAGGGSTIRTTTKASFCEIYNEQVYDLLSPNTDISEDTKGLPVREDATKGVYVEGLVEREVSNTAEALDVLRCGTDNRHVASTQMNRVSSRSHAMFTLTVKSELFAENGVSKVRMSKFTLVDLAGSERQKTTATDGDRLKEASMINNSLLCLGQVINSLVDREKGKSNNHVPFRDSKLTFLLRDSWGGNSKTALVATVTPSLASLSETLSTLKFAQRAKLIKNTAVLNENTCGSVAALQKEITRLRTELAVKTATETGVQVDSKPSANESSDITVSALHNQNTKLSKKVKVLKDASNHREMQVKSMKRKLQQETLIRKCKERRITYLSSKGKTSGMEEDTNGDEVTTLREEVTILREQLEAQPSESVDWMIKYKEEKAKVEDMESKATITFDAEEKEKIESQVVALLDERNTLQAKVESMSNERNTEIDSIIKDVTKLENANIMLQSQLEKKESVIMASEEKIQSSESQLNDLEKEMKTTLECLESTQNELTAEKARTSELQESLDSIKIEVDKANAAAAENQTKVDGAEEELKKLSDEHSGSTTALNTKLSELQKDLDAAMDDNESLMKKLKDASDELEDKKTQLERLDQEKNAALSQLEVNQEKNNTDIESSKLQEKALRAEIKKIEETAEALLAEKTDAASNLERITSDNTSLSEEVESLKSEHDALLQRVETLDKLHETVASLEDEVACVSIEKEQLEEQLQFTQADLERTIRLQENISNTQTAAHDDARSDEIINRLSKEKSTVQTELANVSQQLADNTAKSDDKIEELQKNLSVLQTRADGFDADLKKAKDTVASLESEKIETAKELETIAAQSNTLSMEMEALKVEKDESISELNDKLSQLQTDLDTANEENESLTKKLEEASNELDVKKTELESMEEKKNQALAQLEEDTEKSSTDLESFKRREETLRAEIATAEETIESLTAEKTEATKSIDKLTEQCASLSEEVTALKSERDDLQQRFDTLDEQHKTLTTRAETLDAELKKTGEIVQTLECEKADTVKELEDVTSQGTKLSEALEALKKEHDESIFELNTKLDDLQKDFDATKEDNESLTSKLEEASNDLEAKQKQLESLEEEKSQLLKQLEEGKETSSANLESVKEQTDKLREDISLAEDTIESLTTEKADVVASLEKVTEQCTELSEEVDALKIERSDLQERVETLDKLRDDLLEDELEVVKTEKTQLEEKLKFTEADLERTIRLKEESIVTLTAAHENDLAQRDDTIGTLTEEKTTLQDELAKANQKLAESDMDSNEKVEMLQNEIAYMKEELTNLEQKEKEAREELESTKANYDESSASQEATFNAKISEAESANEDIKKEMEDTKALLSESKSDKEELETKHAAKVTELQELVDQANTRNNELSEKNTTLAERAKAGEVAKSELDLMKEDKASIESERDELKAKIEALEEENATLRDQQTTKQSPPSSPFESKPSPIKPAEEPQQQHDSTFGCDDTFDEDMFLPNIDESAPLDTTLTDHKDAEDESQKSEQSEPTPSRTPFKAKRAMFSPKDDSEPSSEERSEEPSAKKQKKAASSKKKTPAKRMTRSRRSQAASANSKTKTPAKRLTRSQLRSSRTPLGNVNQAETPASSTRKVRSNFSLGGL